VADASAGGCWSHGFHTRRAAQVSVAGALF